MNDRLTRLYDRLTIWERVPLLVSAHARGDDVESDRLLDTSPMRWWRFSEHLLAEQALHVMTLTYVGEQLEAAASYFFALWHMDDPEGRSAKQWLHASQANAYYFTANLDAWRRFCAELGISADALTAANHRGRFLSYCEEHMPSVAPSAETMETRLRESGEGARQVVTADELLASWRNMLHSLTGHVPQTTAGERS